MPQGFKLCPEDKLLKYAGVLKKITGTALASVLSTALLSVTVMATPFDGVPDGMDAQTYELLKDNVMEWNEIEDRVRYFNPSYVMAYNMVSSYYDDLSYAYNDLNAQIDEVDNTIDECYEQQKQLIKLRTGGADVSAELSALSSGIAQAKAGRKVIKSYADSAMRTLAGKNMAVDASIGSVRATLTNLIETLFFSLRLIDINMDLLTKQQELYTSMYQTQAAKQAQGLASAAEVLSAKVQMETAEQTKAGLMDQRNTLLSTIKTQLGYSQDTELVIGSIPEPDLSYVDSATLEAGIEQAMLSNDDLTAAMRPTVRTDTKQNYTMTDQGAMDARDARVNETKGAVSAKIETLYADMQSCRSLYSAADTSKQLADKQAASAERMYSMGLTSYSDYLGQQLAALSYEAAYEQAKLNLVQSINTYKWALRGVVTLDT